MSVWNNLRIGTRLALGIGVILAMLLLLAGFAYVGLSGGNEKFTAYRMLARQTVIASAIKSDLLTARLNVKDFLLKGADKSVSAAQQALSEMNGEIDKSKQLFNDSTEEQAKINDIVALAGQYDGGFKTVISSSKDMVDNTAKLNNIGPKIEQTLTKVLEAGHAAGDTELVYETSEGLRSLLLARLYVTKYLVDNDAAHVDRVQKELVNWKAKLQIILDTQSNAVNRQLVEDAIALGKDYASTFDGVVKATMSRNDAVDNTLNVVGPKVAAISQEIVTENKSQQDELGPRASAEMSQSLTSGLIVAAVAIVVGLLAGWIVTRSITRPVGSMTLAMGVLANGDMTIEIPARGQKDEIGAMANAVQIFKDNMIETARLRAEQEAAKKRIEEERRKSMLTLADRFETTVGGVVTAVSSAAEELQVTAQGLSTTAEEASRQSSVVAAASEQMTQNVQTVAAATEELSSSIREISNQVTESTRIVGGAVTEARATNEKVKGLSEAAQKIGAVVTLINQIAGQTNLLALNATIEAARAGEAGKGFAVVASEVKNLATQTAKATDEIAGQVRSIQDATESSAQAIEGITGTINRVSEISTTIASAVEEQGAATQEISRNVQEAATGATEVSSNIAGVTQASQQTSSGSTQVLAAASELARNGAILKQQVDEFLTGIRAG